MCSSFLFRLMLHIWSQAVLTVVVVGSPFFNEVSIWSRSECSLAVSPALSRSHDHEYVREPSTMRISLRAASRSYASALSPGILLILTLCYDRDRGGILGA